MKKNAFTIIELLAVIIIIAVISLIAVPLTQVYIEESRYNVFKTSVQNFIRELQNENAMVEYKGLYFTFPLSDDSNLGLSGDTSKWVGESFIDADGKIGINISQGKYCAYKSPEEEQVSFNNNCSGWEHENVIQIQIVSNRYDDSTGIYSQLYGEEYVEPTIRAFDIYGQEIPYEVTYSETVDTNVFPKTYTMTVSAEDGRGNNLEKVMTIKIVDHIPPVITVDGHTTDYTVTVESGNQFTVPSATVTDNSGETLGYTVNGMVNSKIGGTYHLIYTAKDSSNNITTLKLTVIVKDTSAPIVTILGNPDTWTNKSVVLAVNATDAGSGISGNAYSYDGGKSWKSGNCVIIDENQTVNIWVRDNNGNTTKNVVVVDKIDKTIPDMIFEVTSGTSGLNYWYKSNVGVKMTPTAGESGVKEYRYCITTDANCTPTTTVGGSTSTNVTLSTESDSNKVCVLVTSVSGQKNTVCSNNYKIDKTLPNVTFEVVSGTIGQNGWYKSNVGVKITPSAGNSGVESYKYCTTTNDSCTPSLTVSGSGSTTVTLYSESNSNKVCVFVTSVAGQQNTVCSNNYKIDKTLPNATFEVASGTLGQNGWYKSNVGVKVTPSAGNSGVESYKYCTTTSDSCTPNTTVSGSGSTTVTLSTESVSNKVCVLVTSVAGQQNTVCSNNYKIDKTAPVITVEGHTSDYTVSFGTRPSYVIPTGTATDNYTSNVVVSRSGSVTPTIIGTYRVTYTATDDAGNTKTLTLTVNVVAPTYSSWMTESELNSAGHTTTEYGIQSKTQYRSKAFDKYTTSSGPIDETSVLAKIYYQDINYIVYENGAWLAQTSSPTYVGTVDGLATYRWNRWGFRTAGVGGYKGSASYHNTQFSVNYVRTDECWSNCGGNGTVTSTTAAFNPQVIAADTGATFSSTLIGIASMGYTSQDYTDAHGYRVSINELGELVEYNADRDGNYGKTSWKYDNNVGNKTYTEGVELSGYSGNVTLSMTTRKIQRRGSSGDSVSGERAYADMTGIYLRERTYKIDKTNTVTTNIVGTYYITTVYGSWSAWQDSAITETSDIKVETRNVYRYQTN